MTSHSSSILALPLSTNITHFLRPDRVLQNFNSLFSLAHRTNNNDDNNTRNKTEYINKACPSDLRRSRPVEGAFSLVTPLSKEFPYAIKPIRSPQDPNFPKQVTLDHIEDYLATLEPDPNYPIHPASSSATADSDPYHIHGLGFTSHSRREHYASLRPRLIHISMKSLKECVPQLNPGEPGSLERQELLKVLSGETVLGRLSEGGLDDKDHHEDSERQEKDGAPLIRSKGYGPWSLAYAGHQFGLFAGQLGDGRAISILSTPGTSEQVRKAFNLAESFQVVPKVELQLKGAGRTPFSRSADGLAVLRSSLREYMGSESCHLLTEFPTSRSLSLIKFDNLHVQREKIEKGAIVCRMSPSWIRIGNFELCRFREDWTGLQDLVDYVSTKVFDFKSSDEEAEKTGQKKLVDDEVLAIKLIREVMTRNAKMVAAWQAWGFVCCYIYTFFSFLFDKAPHKVFQF